MESVQRGGFVQKLWVLAGRRRGERWRRVAFGLLSWCFDAQVQRLSQARWGLVALCQVAQVLQGLVNTLWVQTVWIERKLGCRVALRRQHCGGDRELGRQNCVARVVVVGVLERQWKGAPILVWLRGMKVLLERKVFSVSGWKNSLREYSYLSSLQELDETLDTTLTSEYEATISSLA